MTDQKRDNIIEGLQVMFRNRPRVGQPPRCGKGAIMCEICVRQDQVAACRKLEAAAILVDGAVTIRHIISLAPQAAHLGMCTWVLREGEKAEAELPQLHQAFMYAHRPQLSIFLLKPRPGLDLFE